MGRVQERMFSDQQRAAAPDRVRLAYEFFISHAATDFSLEELARYVGWRPSTVSTYRSRLYRDWWERTAPDRYRFVEILRMSEQEFRELHSQSRFRVPAWYRRLTGPAARDQKHEFLPPIAWRQITPRHRHDILRHCLALATVGGGTIVIGAVETGPGQFQAEGLSPEQLRDSSPATIATELQGLSSGSLRINVRPVLVEEKWFLELLVKGHDGVPPVPRSSEFGLCQGHVYYRTIDGQSVPVASAEELAQALGLGSPLLG